ncbi:MAG: phage tail tape measure protein [Clostridia bacterium]|nr:phage tail tape measure protein [Clostridia bacterium]
MAEVVKVQVQAETSQAESKLEKVQKIFDTLSRVPVRIQADVSGLQNAGNRLEEISRKTSQFGIISKSSFDLYTQGIINAKAATEGAYTSIDKATTKAKSDIQSFVDSMVGITRETSQITAKTSMFGKVSDETFASYTSGVMSGAEATSTLEKNVSTLGSTAQKTGSVLDSLTQRFTAANLASALITAAISRLRQSLREATTEMKEMDKELTTIKMVTGASDSEIEQLRQSAFQKNGRTTTDYLSAAERFARAGYRENIEDLTKLSLVTQNVGGVTEDVASKFILAADAAWQLHGNTQELYTILDGMAAVSDQNATDIGKLAEGITVSGSAFANAGESAQTYTAMMGTVTAATQRSGSEVARGLMTILYRVRQVKGELDDGEMIDAADISNAAKALDSVGISVMNDSKELKSFSEIMGELAGKWDILDSKQKAYLQNALAGNRRGNILYAFMDNYDMYMKQLDQYSNSAGNALQKNEIYTESWEAATNNLKKSWTELVSTMTDGGQALIDIVNFGGQLLDGINTLLQNNTNTKAADSFTAQWQYMVKGVKELREQQRMFPESVSWQDYADLILKATYSYGILGEAQEDVAKETENLSDATIQVIKTYKEESDAVNELANAFSNAQSRIKAASEGMKEEKDDSVKSISDIYKKMIEAEKNKYYGSNAYKQGADLLFGTTDKSKITKEAKDALEAYFKGIEKGDYSNSAAKLWKQFADGEGNVVDEAGNVIATMYDVGDSYEWAFNKGGQTMDEFLQSMQASTGIGANFWASMIQSLGMYSDEMDEWMAEHSEPEVTYTITADNDQAKSAVEEINSMLANIKDKTVYITVVEQIQGKGVGEGKQIVLDAYNQSKGRSWIDGYGSTVPGRAGGKRDSYSGLALVNDEFPANGTKPELIISKSQGRAYIANGGKPAVVNLRSDDVVLTARETKSALGIPGFPTGKGTLGTGKTILSALVPNLGPITGSGQEAITISTPKVTEETKTTSAGGKKKAAAKIDPDESWGTLKKLVDYLLDKGNDDLKEQLKVLDDQLEALEAERDAQEEANKLAELQLDVDNALLDLQKANTERTVRYYNEQTQQWEWMADQKAVADAQEAYDKALESMNKYLEEQDYAERKAAIEAQKQALQDQYNEYKESWEAIVDAIEAPSGDIKKLLNELTKGGTSTMQAQTGGIAALLNALRTGVVDEGYFAGLLNINNNTSGSTTTSSTTFDSGGIAFGSGIMRKGTAGAETVIGPDITRAILNPVRNANFSTFADSVRTLMGVADAAVAGGSSSITNNSGGNIIVNGVKIGSDQMNKPFAEVMKNIVLHVNESA